MHPSSVNRDTTYAPGEKNRPQYIGASTIAPRGCSRPRGLLDMCPKGLTFSSCGMLGQRGTLVVPDRCPHQPHLRYRPHMDSYGGYPSADTTGNSRYFGHSRPRPRSLGVDYALIVGPATDLGIIAVPSFDFISERPYQQETTI